MNTFENTFQGHLAIWEEEVVIFESSQAGDDKASRFDRGCPADVCLISRVFGRRSARPHCPFSLHS
eukprot:3064593-Pyramimonas_sp.AAC.1